MFILVDALSGLNFSGPVCVGNILIFECTATGGVSTVWSGTVFSCSSADNEIVLLHSRFISSISNTSNSCNNETVVGQGLYVDHEHNVSRYTSQLNVTIDFTLTGKDITCVLDNGIVTHVVGCHTLSLHDFTCSNNSDDTGQLV